MGPGSECRHTTLLLLQQPLPRRHPPATRPVVIEIGIETEIGTGIGTEIETGIVTEIEIGTETETAIGIGIGKMDKRPMNRLCRGATSW